MAEQQRDGNASSHPHGPTGLTDSRCLSCKDGTCIVHARKVTLKPGDPGYNRLARKIARRIASENVRPEVSGG